MSETITAQVIFYKLDITFLIYLEYLCLIVMFIQMQEAIENGNKEEVESYLKEGNSVLQKDEV